MGGEREWRWRERVERARVSVWRVRGGQTLIHTYIHTYTYLYSGRERESERDRPSAWYRIMVEREEREREERGWREKRRVQGAREAHSAFTTRRSSAR